MKLGDWVFFKTRNWPEDVRNTQIDFATGETRDLTREELYQGRGRVIGIAGSNITVREEKSERLVEVGPHPEDEIRPLGYGLHTLTLGDLRVFLEEHKDVPDDVPVVIALPLAFFSDEDDIPADHPEYKAASACQAVDASGIILVGMSESGATADGYIPLEEREGDVWDFWVEIMPNNEQAYEAMHESDDD